MLVKCLQKAQIQLFLCLLCNVTILNCQNSILLDPSISPDHEVIFTPQYIKNYGLKTVVIDVLDKRDNEMLKDYQKRKKLVYDSLGRCKHILYTFPSIYGNIFTTAKVKDGRVLKREQALAFDSIIQYYFYNNKNQYIKTVQGNGLQFYNYLYAYDSANQLKAEKKIYEVCRVMLDGICEPEHQKMLYEAYYKTTYYGKSQSKTIVYNDEKRPYKEIIRNYNDKGSILSEQEEFLLSPYYTKYVWQYDAKNRLVSKTYYKEEKENWKMEFDYDENNRLIAERIYKLKILTNEISFIYEIANGVINSYLNRDVLSKSMQIGKFSYVLRD
jgi:YD repeat-containing protein